MVSRRSIPYVKGVEADCLLCNTTCFVMSGQHLACQRMCKRGDHVEWGRGLPAATIMRDDINKLIPKTGVAAAASLSKRIESASNNLACDSVCHLTDQKQIINRKGVTAAVACITLSDYCNITQRGITCIFFFFSSLSLLWPWHQDECSATSRSADAAAKRLEMDPVSGGESIKTLIFCFKWSAAQTVNAYISLWSFPQSFFFYSSWPFLWNYPLFCDYYSTCCTRVFF